MRPDDPQQHAVFLINVLSTLLVRRTIDHACREANLEELDAILRQKRGCRR